MRHFTLPLGAVPFIEQDISDVLRLLSVIIQAGEDISDTITRIGTIHHERHEFDSALTCHAYALQLRESAKPPNLASIATNLVGIANAHRANNELAEALG